jgi:hypothetical protein
LLPPAGRGLGSGFGRGAAGSAKTPLEGASETLAMGLLTPPEDFSAVSVRLAVSSAAFCCAHSGDARRTLRAAATHQLRICSS